jgi:hypothetical protein
MKKVIERLEKAKTTVEEMITDDPESNRPYWILDNIRDALYELRRLSRWETPKQYEARTGQKWPDNWAVYAWFASEASGNAQAMDYSVAKVASFNCIVCATEAGPPLEDWKPEKK